MAFQISPGVSVSEIDLTTRVPVPSISDGATAGPFKWGPLEEVRLVTNEQELVNLFGKPDGATYKSFFTASNFLNYSNKLRVVRAANTSSANNATSSGTGYLVRNDREYQNTYESATTAGVDFFAKYPGEIGNSLKVSLCQPTRANTKVVDNIVTVDSNTDIVLTGNFIFTGGETTITTDSDTASAANVDVELRVGDVLYIDVDVNESTTVATKLLVTEIQDTNTFSVVQEDGTEGLGNDSISGFKLARYKRSPFTEDSRNMFGTLAWDSETAANNKVITGTNTQFELQLSVGDIISFRDNSVVNRRKVQQVVNSTAILVTDPLVRSFSGASYSREWEFASDFQSEPLTSEYAYKLTGNKDVCDEIHVIVVDEDGLITGRKDIRGETSRTSKSILTGEIYPNLSVANGAVNSTGEQLYYKDKINNQSNYIRWGDHNSAGDVLTYTDTGDNDITTPTKVWGATLEQGNSNARFIGGHSANVAGTGTSYATITSSFGGGNDGSNISDADRIIAFSYLKEPSLVDVSLLMSGEASNTVANFLIGEIADYRKDCVVFISPEESQAVNAGGNEVTNIIAKRIALPSSSYAVMDGNYKYQYDSYNSVYRYVPFNGDVAGLCAQADNTNPYISPAGFNRGNLKNTDKLAFDPSQAQRDELYIKNINPIVAFPGQGKVLFGDKTLLAKPSAFDRINVRRLFIILEKAIANAAQFSLFEFNDAFTRAQFVSIVDPFLRDVQGRRGIVDFRVICDESNNPPSVVDRNEFRGDIFVKPSRSINFINLNFVAVASGVEFSEVVNAV